MQAIRTMYEPRLEIKSFKITKHWQLFKTPSASKQLILVPVASSTGLLSLTEQRWDALFGARGRLPSPGSLSPCLTLRFTFSFYPASSITPCPHPLCPPLQARRWARAGVQEDAAVTRIVVCTTRNCGTSTTQCYWVWLKRWYYWRMMCWNDVIVFQLL